jgi:hypothetical protein
MMVISRRRGRRNGRMEKEEGRGRMEDGGGEREDGGWRRRVYHLYPSSKLEKGGHVG